MKKKSKIALYIAVWVVDSDPTVVISRTKLGLYKKLWAGVCNYYEDMTDDAAPTGKKYESYLDHYFHHAAIEGKEYVEYITYTEKDIE